MVAPVVAAAGIGAIGSLVGGVAGGKGAKKARKAAARSQREQIAAVDRNRNFQYSLNAPTIGTANQADSTIAGLLQIGGDPAASAQAYDRFKSSTGYTTRLNEGLGATNNSYFAGGLGQSGANLKALTRYGQDYASNEYGKYMGYLGGVSATGQNARGLVAGVGNNATNQFMSASQTGAAGQIAAINAGTANTQNMIQNLANTGAWYMANRSSYQPPSTYRIPAYTQVPVGG